MGVPLSLSVLGLATLFYIGCGFNIDTKFSVIKELASSDAYFGYSVAQHFTEENKLPNIDPSRARILIGAPHARSAFSVLNDFNQTGALYNCPLDLQNQNMVDDCTEFPYPDTQLQTVGIADLADENKTDMWLGVNIRSSGAGKFVVACGHRYKVVEKGIPVPNEDVLIDAKGEKQVNVYGLGICYFYKADLTIDEDEENVKLPCSGKALVGGDNSIAGEYGVCAAGTGLAAENADVIYGIPGAKNFRGTVGWDHRVDFVDGSSFYRNPFINSSEAPTKLNSYRGYSAVIVRNLINDPNEGEVTVIGAPSDEDYGAVIVYEMDQTKYEIREKYKLTGSQFGSGFGTSIAVVDINNDHHPSMVVGAPFYRSSLGEDANSRAGIGGAAYFYQNYGDGIRGASSSFIITPGQCKARDTSMCINAQFGYSVAGVGDVNGDGYHDLAIGAPFYGNGAVFLYNGRKDGKLETEASQIIMAEDVSSAFISRSISGFGISLSGGQNMDGQGYTDILVGAHASSHVVLLRSRPVITIDGSINLNSTSLSPTAIVCLSDPTSSVTCIDYTICFSASFSDTGATSNADAKATIEYTVTADSGYEYASNRRVLFNLKNNGTLDSVKTGRVVVDVVGKEKCLLQRIYVSELHQFLKAVEFEMRYKLVKPDKILYENINTDPIMNIFTPTKPTAKIDFERECTTPRCETDLAVRALFTDTENVIPAKDSDNKNEFVFDSNSVPKLNVTIHLNVNSELDRAYESHVYVTLEPELRYIGVASKDEELTSCSENNDLNGVACRFGSSILEGGSRQVTLTLAFDGLGPTFTTINITANTTSEDIVPENDFAMLKVKVNIVTDLQLFGSVTEGDIVEYGQGEVRGVSAMKKDSDIGDLVRHIYTVYNSGSYGQISKVTLTVQWPYEIASSGEYLLYMIMFPKVVSKIKGKGQCKVMGKSETYINSLGLELVDEDTGEDEDTVITYSRRKRATKGGTGAISTGQSTDGSSRQIADLNCYDKTAKCFEIVCEFFDLGPGESAKVRFNSRLWKSSLTNVFGSNVDMVRITSTGHLSIDAAAKVSQTNTENDGTNVTTEARPDFSEVENKIAIWIIAVAAGAGVLVLIVIILVCWQCGFFVRNRPATYGVKVEKQKGAYEQVSQKEPETLTLT